MGMPMIRELKHGKHKENEIKEKENVTDLHLLFSTLPQTETETEWEWLQHFRLFIEIRLRTVNLSRAPRMIEKFKRNTYGLKVKRKI